MKTHRFSILSIILIAGAGALATLTTRAAAQDEPQPTDRPGARFADDGPPYGPMAGGRGMRGGAGPMAGGRGGRGGLGGGPVRDAIGGAILQGVSRLSIPFVLRPEVREEIKLTDDQAKKLQDLEYSKQREAIELESKTRLVQLDLRQLLNTDEKPDRAKVMAKLDDLGKLRTDQSKLDVDRLLAVREALTEEQVTQVRQLVRERAQERREAVGAPTDDTVNVPGAAVRGQRGGGRQGFGPGRGGRGPNAGPPAERRPRQDGPQDIPETN